MKQTTADVILHRMSHKKGENPNLVGGGELEG